MPLYEVNPQPWSLQQIYSESYVLRLEQRIAVLEAKLARKDAMISALCARLDDDEEAIDAALQVKE